MESRNIVVVGAGVIGLTTALLLAEDVSNGYQVTVIAKHMPGDYDAEYTSPWAGANYQPFGLEGTREADYEKDTWPWLFRLASQYPEAGVGFLKNHIYGRNKDAGSTTGTWFAGLLAEKPWFQSLFPDYRSLEKNELPQGVDHGTTFQTVCINTALYLPWLLSRCISKGVVFRRGSLKHICEAANVHDKGHADVIVNCTGLSAATLGGVQDTSVVPARGQIVVVRNQCRGMHVISGVDGQDGETSYVMQRPGGGGTVLGGCYQKDNFDSQPDPNMAVRIMQRAVQLCPELTNGRGIEHLDVIRHCVGFRPVRKGGPRIDRERVNGKWVVNCYGHGGGGYQASYGSAIAAKDLVDGSYRLLGKL